jgi:hypothetical protein
MGGHSLGMSCAVRCCALVVNGSSAAVMLHTLHQLSPSPWAHSSCPLFAADICGEAGKAAGRREQPHWRGRVLTQLPVAGQEHCGGRGPGVWTGASQSRESGADDALESVAADIIARRLWFAAVVGNQGPSCCLVDSDICVRKWRVAKAEEGWHAELGRPGTCACGTVASLLFPPFSPPLLVSPLHLSCRSSRVSAAL